MAGKYDMPGQTKALDEKAADAEALKIFYTTLYQQRPDSEMAPRWLLQHGLLERDVAEKLCKTLKKETKGASSSGSKHAPPKKKPKPPAPKRTVMYDDSSDDVRLCPAQTARARLATPARCALQDYEEEKLPQSKRSAKKPAAAAPKKPVAPDSSDEVRGPLLARAGLSARALTARCAPQDYEEMPLSKRSAAAAPKKSATPASSKKAAAAKPKPVVDSSDEDNTPLSAPR